MSVQVWKPIEGWGNNYEVSNWGHVRRKEYVIVRKNGRPNTYRAKLLKLTKKSNGYLHLALGNNKNRSWVNVHRLVAAVFVPNPEGKDFVNHKDGNKTNNRFDNLEWVTPQENSRHASENGLLSKGEHRRNSKLKGSDVLLIRRLRKVRPDIFLSDFAIALDVCTETVRNAINGDNWKHIKE